MELILFIFFILFVFNLFSSNKEDTKEESKSEDLQEILEDVKKESVKQQEKPKPKPKQDHLKEKGDRYERYIGTKFEKKGDFVVYNGFIRGYKDRGVDIVTISLKTETINLVQCKNWTKKPMKLEDIEEIYFKLDNYTLDIFALNAEEIKQHLTLDKTDINKKYNKAKQNQDNYEIRKTLYIGSDRVIDLNIGKELVMIQKDIFRYRDMKIVIEKLD